MHVHRAIGKRPETTVARLNENYCTVILIILLLLLLKWFDLLRTSPRECIHLFIYFLFVSFHSRIARFQPNRFSYFGRALLCCAVRIMWLAMNTIYIYVCILLLAQLLMCNVNRINDNVATPLLAIAHVDERIEKNDYSKYAEDVVFLCARFCFAALLM